MALDESDLQSFRRDGARLRGRNGKSVDPLPAEKPSASEEISRITEAIQVLGKAMTELARRQQNPAPPPGITVEAPKVTVKAPEVTVTPHIEIIPSGLSSPKGLEGEVTERDRDGYAKKFVIRFI